MWGGVGKGMGLRDYKNTNNCIKDQDKEKNAKAIFSTVFKA